MLLSIILSYQQLLLSFNKYNILWIDILITYKFNLYIIYKSSYERLKFRTFTRYF
jgi:hypothetical protein